MRMKDITHVVDPGRIIPKEDTEVEDHNYYGQKIREYVLKRLNELVVNKSEELNKGKIINPPEIPKVTPETEEYFSGVSYEGSYPKLEEATKKGKTFYFPLTNKNLKNVYLFHNESLEEHNDKESLEWIKKNPEQAKTHPIVIARHPDGSLHVTDGQHRFNSALKSGKTHVRAFIFNVPEEHVNKIFAPNHISKYYPQFGKSEELKKVPTPYDIRSEDDVDHNTYKNIKKVIHTDKDSKGFTHKVLIDPKNDNEILHTLHSPKGEKIAQLKITRDLPNDVPGGQGFNKENIISHVTVSPESKYRGKGFGRKLYLNALKYHKSLTSDSTVSPMANKVWKKISKLKNVDTELAPYNDYDSTPHRAWYYKSEDLDKGAKGDWQKDPNYNFKVEHHEYTLPLRPGKKYRSTTVTAYHKNKKFSNQEIFDIMDKSKGDYRNFNEANQRFNHPELGGLIGSATFESTKGDKNEGEVGHVHVDENHRRKGIASEMYKLFEKSTGMKAKPSTAQYENAKKLWAQPNRPFGKSEELDKGAKGDWQKEGYIIRHFKTPHGVTVEAYKGNEKVGYLEAAHSQADKTKLYPIQTEVDFDHQRKGLATAMYQHAEKIMGKPFRPGSQSKEAKALWGQKSRPFGKSEDSKE